MAARQAGLPGLDLVPLDRLHLTVQPIGFADEVGPGGFTPHVSLAYSNTDGPDTPYATALAATRTCTGGRSSRRSRSAQSPREQAGKTVPVGLIRGDLPFRAAFP